MALIRFAMAHPYSLWVFICISLNRWHYEKSVNVCIDRTPQRDAERGNAKFLRAYVLQVAGYLILLTCNPHSFFVLSSHHQRPARSCWLGSMGRVQGSQPMLVKPLL